MTRFRRSLTALLGVGLALASTDAFAFDTMKTIMKELDSLVSSGQTQRAAYVLTAVSGLASPKEFPEWEAIAKKGAAAERRGDTAGARASCKSCHDKYKDSFKAKYGSGRVPRKTGD